MKSLCAVAFRYMNNDIHQIQTIQFHRHTKTNKNTHRLHFLNICLYCPYSQRKLLKLALKRAHIGHFTVIGRDFQISDHFLPGASLSHRVLSKHPCTLAQSPVHLLIQPRITHTLFPVPTLKNVLSF